MQRETRLVLALSVVFLLVQAAPFLFAQAAADDQHVFAGFLLNPIDGSSYLAKMRQGFDGAWSFVLPYTANPGEGTALNLYYLFLGHAARVLGWGLVFTLHAARLLGAAALCAALWHLLKNVLPEGQRTWAFALALFGSGLGWLSVLAGMRTSDFWVAEAYPFLSTFANAHFPLGLALQIYLLTPTRAPRPLAWLLAAALLSIIYLFGWAVAVAVLAGQFALAYLWRQETSKALSQAVYVFLGGLPYTIYVLWAIRTHPMLTAWSAQNLTPALPLLNTLISLSPAVLFAAVAGYYVLRQRDARLGGLLVWAVVCLVLLYSPVGPQRRLLSGIYVPLAALAVSGVLQLFRTRWRVALIYLLVLALPTNLLILLRVQQGVRAQEPMLYVHTDQLAAYAWLDANGPGALVMASAENGQRLPSYADVRVWYGHPMETAESPERHGEMEAFFENRLDQDAFLALNNFDFVLHDARRAPDFDLRIAGWEVVFTSGAVSVLAPQR